MLRGDQAALDQLLSLCWESVVNYAASITGAFDTADDIAQETFIRIWTHRDVWNARGGASLGLIFRIARNLSLNALRTENRRERHIALYRELNADSTHVDPSWGESSRLRRASNAAIAALPPRRREIFTLARFHGLTYAEIAETMGISQQTVANQMSAALDTLRSQLAEFMDDASPPQQSGA